MKHMLMIFVALLGFALVTGSVTRGSSGLEPARGMIRITSRDADVKLVNRGSSSRGMGDVLLIRQLLFNKGITRKAIGHSDLVCTYTGRRSRQCNGTYFLPEGQDRRRPARCATAGSSSSPSSEARTSTTTCAAR